MHIHTYKYPSYVWYALVIFTLIYLFNGGLDFLHFYIQNVCRMAGFDNMILSEAYCLYTHLQILISLLLRTKHLSINHLFFHPSSSWEALIKYIFGELFSRQ